MTRLAILLDGREIASVDLSGPTAAVVSAADRERVLAAIPPEGVTKGGLWQTPARRILDVDAVLAALIAEGAITATKDRSGRPGARATRYRRVTK